MLKFHTQRQFRESRKSVGPNNIPNYRSCFASRAINANFNATNDITTIERKCDPFKSTTATPTPDGAFLAFRTQQTKCLKGSPEKFRRWLNDSEDIASLDDLVNALLSQKARQWERWCEGIHA
jgi:hypothetical protein